MTEIKAKDGGSTTNEGIQKYYVTKIEELLVSGVVCRKARCIVGFIWNVPQFLCDGLPAF